MSLDTRFTEEEKFLLTNTPFTIGSAMVFAGGSGLGTVKELFSNTKAFMAGAKTFPKNEIIVGILPNMQDRDEAKTQAKAFQEKSKTWFKEKGITSAEQMNQLVVDNSREVAKLLKEKATPEEAAEYKEWAMSIAESVAKAAKEGGFLGFGGERVSANEKEFYASIADALGSSSQLS